MDATGGFKTFCEFFAGIGLVHAGLQKSGWRCVYANDIDSKKHQMYEGHFGRTPYYHVHDVWDVHRSLKQIPERPFLATASFPCVDLSLAGHWKGFEGERSSTYFGFIEVLRALGPRRPSVVMLENVYGFLTSDGGKDFTKAIGELAALGYWTDAIVLDAKWFVPQSRPRVFVFGFHESIKHHVLPQTRDGFTLNSDWAAAIDATRVLRPAPLRRAIDNVELVTGWATVPFQPPIHRAADLATVLDVDEEQEWWDEKAVAKHYELMEPPSRARVDDFVHAGTTAVGTAFRRTRREKARTEVRFDIAGCLRTPKGGSAKQLVIAIAGGKLRMRWMSAIEYARLQGAGDFKITVPPSQAMYGFGDAVCVPAISWIDQQILTPLFEAANETPSSLAAVDNLTPPARKRAMSAVKSSGTRPELTIIAILRRMRLKFDTNRRDLPGRPDIVLERRKKVLFIHGCFWHLHHCRAGQNAPKTNEEYWRAKRDRNHTRDAPLAEPCGGSAGPL